MPGCLQATVRPVLELTDMELDMTPYPDSIQEYIREELLQNVQVQENALREELLKTWLLTPGGPKIVRSILSHNNSPMGEKIYSEIREEAKRYE
jgi:predicted naringenin-chalcone synthase